MRWLDSAKLHLPAMITLAVGLASCGSGAHAYNLGIPPTQPAVSPSPRPTLSPAIKPSSLPTSVASAKASASPGTLIAPIPTIAPSATISPTATPTLVAAIVPTPSPSPVSTPSGPATLAPATNLTQTFASNNVATSQWQISGYSCLTGGDAGTPPTSIPACPTKNDPNGSGFLRITSNAGNSEGFAVSQTPIILQAGHTALTVTFDYYAYGGNGADGLCVFLLDATQPIPTSPGAPGGSLGYSGISSGYVGLGLDSFGNFSNGNGGPGRIPESIAIRGGSAASFAYIGGYLSGGIAASLPFSLDSVSMVRPTPLTVSVTYNSMPATATVQINRNDGSGLITYISNLSLSVAGEPAFPPRVYLGFSASNGGSYDYHEVGNVTIMPS